MKTFFNVLYRRILYKIPLKFLLVLLAIVAVFIASFSNAGLVINSNDYSRINQRYDLFAGENEIVCVKPLTDCTTYYFYIGEYDANGDENGVAIGSQNPNSYLGVCSQYGLFYDPGRSCTVRESVISFTQYTSLECQTNYSLIPVSSVNQSYCVNNNLCPSSDCPVCPEGGSGFSNVYINDIFHPSAFNIIMNIPEEIDWDYAYTNNGTNLNIDVVGYNVDYEYMDNVVDIQNYKPGNEDLQSIITDIIPLFVPGLVIILFLYFIFKFIKKVF